MRALGESVAQSGNDFLTEWTELSVEHNVEQAESNGTCERQEIDTSVLIVEIVSHVVHLTLHLFVLPGLSLFPNSTLFHPP